MEILEAFDSWLEGQPNLLSDFGRYGRGYEAEICILKEVSY